MVRDIVRDERFLSLKAEPATQKDVGIGMDLQDTLKANADRCVGMAANMIGFNKRIIIVSLGFMDLVMFNPEVVRKDTPYQTEEGCLSLDGVRSVTRYRNIEICYLDFAWKKHVQKFSGFAAQICQHELDHLEGRII